jgi:hypothetical protein
MKFVNIVGVVIEANGPDEAKAVFARAVDAGSHHAVIVHCDESLTPWPCDVAPNSAEDLLGAIRDAIEDLDKPMFAIKKHEGYSELVVTKASIVHNDESLMPWPGDVARCAAEDEKPATVVSDAMALPEVSEKIMKRSYQRSGVVAEGTSLSSGAKQATVTFTPLTFDKLKLAADKNGVSLSEMVRQCVDIALR